MAMLFIYSGQVNRVDNKNRLSCFSVIFCGYFYALMRKVTTGECGGFQDNGFHDKVELLCEKNIVQDLACLHGLPFLLKDH